jgi:hypothetical protein
MSLLHLLAQSLPASHPATPPHITLSFLSGINCALNFVAALLFLRFHRKTHDRLFLFFAGAFALFAASRIVFYFASIPDDANSNLYLIRLAGFILILIAILDKNRTPRPKPTP